MSEVDFHFFVVSHSGAWRLPETFFGMKKYCSWQKLLNFQIAKIHIITLHAQTLIAIPRKSTLKSIFSYIFWDKCLKLGSYVLGTKTKLSSDQNFDLGLSDLGLRSENIEFWKLPVAQNPSKMGTGNFQNSIFSLLRPKSKFWSLESFVLAHRTQLPSLKHLSQKR